MPPSWDDDIFFDPESGSLGRGSRAASAYPVNCPHCGEIIEAVCPRPGETPRSVSAHGFLGLLFTSETFQEPTRMTCPDCGRFMVVRWLF
jgi:ribosomal protein S27E